MGSDSLLSEMIDQKIRYTNQRMQVLAQNIANSSTPGFKAMDVKAPDFKQVLVEVERPVITRTQPGHLSATTNLSSSMFPVIAREEPSQLKPNGNNVTLEEEVMKMSQNSFDHQLVLSLHESSEKLYKRAVGLPVN